MPKIPYSKRPDGRYYKQIVIGFDENGKRKVKTLYDRNWRELDKKVREFQLSLDNDTYIEKDITLGECIDLWWKTKVNITPPTKRIYNEALKKVRNLECFRINDIKPKHFQDIYSEMYNSQCASMITTLSRLLKAIFNFAQKNKYINNNVANDAIVPKYKQSTKRRALTENEKSAIFQAMNDLKPVEKAMIGILLYTGMRRNEMLDLKVSDINFEENYIYVQRTLVYEEHYKIYEKNAPKSQAGIRKIPMIPELKTILSEYIDKYVKNEQGYLFLTRNNTFITSGNFCDKWKRILRKINKYRPQGQETNITPHYFRHNYATDLIYAGVSPKTVQYIMGHEKADITMNIYADIRVNNKDVIDQILKYNNKSIQNL